MARRMLLRLAERAEIARPARQQVTPMSRTLVVYYSRTGTTKKVASALASALGADLEEIVDLTNRRGLRGYLRSGFDATLGRLARVEPARNNPRDYDLVVLGTPVWNASVSSPVRTYAVQHSDAMKDVAFFCTCGGPGGEHVVSQLMELCGKRPEGVLILSDAEIARGADARIAEFARTLGRAPERPQPPEDWSTPAPT
jgi:flavodoxin